MERFRSLIDSTGWLATAFGLLAFLLGFAALDFEKEFVYSAFVQLCLGVAVCMYVMLLIMSVIRRRHVDATINGHKMAAAEIVKRYLTSGEATRGASFHVLMDNLAEVVGASFTEYTSHRAWCTIREVITDKHNNLTIKGGDEDFLDPQQPSEAFYAIWAYLCGDGVEYYLCNDIENVWMAWLAGEPGPDGHVQPVDSHSWGIFYRDFMRLFGRRVSLNRRAVLVLPIRGQHEASWLDGNRDASMEGQIVRKVWGYLSITVEFAKTLDEKKAVEIAQFYAGQVEDVIHAMFPAAKSPRLSHR